MLTEASTGAPVAALVTGGGRRLHPANGAPAMAPLPALNWGRLCPQVGPLQIPRPRCRADDGA
eukprot:3015420-Prymnesium_polylepis.1